MVERVKICFLISLRPDEIWTWFTFRHRKFLNTRFRLKNQFSDQGCPLASCRIEREKFYPGPDLNPRLQRSEMMAIRDFYHGSVPVLDSSVVRALARKARGPGSRPGLYNFSLSIVCFRMLPKSTSKAVKRRNLQAIWGLNGALQMLRFFPPAFDDQLLYFLLFHRNKSHKGQIWGMSLP